MKVRADSFRAKISAQLVGRGLELGPGQIQFPSPNADEVILVDKLHSKEHIELFPELGPDVYIVEPDFLIDFDTDGLKTLEESSFDFVIASHLLEHLAQPFKMLDEIWRVLKPNGVAVIFLPDRRRTFDRKRTCQSFEHFFDEYQRTSHEVDVDDLRDYLLKVENYSLVELNNDFVKFHLARSIHVHAWTDKEFIRIFSQMQRFSNFNFEITEAISSSKNKNFEEFGFVIRKKTLSSSEQSSSALESEWISALQKPGMTFLAKLLGKF
jgi:SAM-dependent methyltransferase